MTDVANLRSSLADLITESQALRKDVESAERTRRRENLFNAIISILGVIVIGLVLAIAYQTNEVSDQISSCTTPNGKCYQDSTKRTSGTVLKLVQGYVYVAECNRIAKTDAELEACVSAKLGQPLPTKLGEKGGRCHLDHRMLSGHCSVAGLLLDTAAQQPEVDGTKRQDNLPSRAADFRVRG